MKLVTRSWLLGGVLTLCLFLGVSYFVSAQTFSGTYEVHGYAWSDTIGWVSFNCDSDPDTCGSVDYKVVISPHSTYLAQLTGYAWSDNIGWIKFGGLDATQSFMPSLSKSLRRNVVIIPDGPFLNRLYGWARACSATTPGDCSSMTIPNEGWDGWISFNCADFNGTCNSNRNYSVIVGNGTLTGYAWGSNVVGWLKMVNVTFDQPCTASNACELDNSGYDSVTQWCENVNTDCSVGLYCLNDVDLCEVIDITDYSFDAPAIVRSGTPASLSWNINDPSEVDSCTVTGNNGDSWSSVSNTVTTSVLTRPITTYDLTCVTAGGGPTVTLDTINIMTLPMIIES